MIDRSLPAGHVALLGDSVFDNGRYTEGGPDVIAQLRHILPRDWRATLLAIDGSVIEDIEAQANALAEDVSHVMLSVGGNDVLSNLDVMNESARKTAQSLAKLHARADRFKKAYRHAVESVQRRVPATTVCAIYNGNLSQGDAALLGLGTADIAVLRTALSPFNDAIFRVAFERGLDVIDLRLVCTEPEDYANPIEPSSHGAEKIARAIASVLGLKKPGKAPSRVFIDSPIE